ncbi:hypothetical protein ACJJTC_005611 [Scirpophaga incertulas]
MGVKTSNDNSSTLKYTFHRKAGRSIIEKSPIFSPDGESLLVIVENVIRVYNIQTGDCVRTLETETFVKELIGHNFPAEEDYNLYACSDNGCVTAWTWENGAVLRETILSLPHGSRVVTFNLMDSKKCFITAIHNSFKYLHLGCYSLKNGELIHKYTSKEILYSEMIHVSLGFYNDDQIAVLCNGSKNVYIQNLNNPHISSEISNQNRFRVLSVTASRNAVGICDTLGRVTIIRGNLFDYKSVAREVLHWHFLPVMTVCFSQMGNYLYSGGMEKVLIKWTIGNLNIKANEKSFIPRLPGMIRFIAVNNTHIAMTLTNNSIVVASAQMRVVSTILECGGLSPVARAIGTPLVYHRQLGALLMGGRTGHLQLYSTTTDKVLYNIDITGMNNIPPARRNLLPLETEVTCMCVSATGNWLVTAEYRNDGCMYPEEMLKFWMLDVKKSSPFKLNTCVNLPHGGCNIVSLSLNNKGEYCVSAGADEKFRIWKRENENNKFAWNCLTACYYSSGSAQFLTSRILNDLKCGESYELGKVENFPYLTTAGKNDVIQKLFNIHKEDLFDSKQFAVKGDSDFEMGGIAISQDGSLIAAWFGCKLTLWDTHYCNLRTILSHPTLRPKGVHVKFGNNDAAHYLACTTEQCLAVWSLISLTVKWLVQLSPTCLAADPFSNKMAVTTSNNDVYVFTPHSSQPILTRKGLLNKKTGVFKQCTFGGTKGDEIRLYIMRNNSEIYSLEPEIKDEGSLEVMTHRNLPSSNFSSLLAEQQSSDVRRAIPIDPQSFGVTNTGHDSILQFLTASPHMMPPVSLLCTAFLQNMSGQQQPEETAEEKEDQTEGDSDSSDDEVDDVPKVNNQSVPKVTEYWAPNYEEIKEKKLKKILKEPIFKATEAILG